jgi:Flp pilus assembly protein TadG
MVSAEAGSSRPCRRLLDDQRAVSAVEFALVLPIMVLLLFGGVELGDALTIDRKVTHVTSTLSDLVAQSKTITDADMATIFNAATWIMTPYSATTLKMKVSGINIDDTSKATVAWGYAQHDVALAKGAVVTVPAALLQPNTFLVLTEVHYPYTPDVGYVMTGTYDLTDKFYLRPRLSAKVCQNSTTC